MRDIAPHTGKTLFTLVLLAVAMLAPCALHAASPDAGSDDYEQRVAALRLQLTNDASTESLARLGEQAARLSTQLQKCVREREAQIAEQESELKRLGEPQPDEGQLLTAERAQLERDQAKTKSALANCRILLDETLEIGKSIQSRQRKLIRQKLLLPGPGLVGLAIENLSDPSPWAHYTVSLLAQSRGLLALGLASMLMLAGVMLAGMLPGLFARPWLLRWGGKRTDNDFTSILLQSMALGLARYLPWLLASVAGSVFFLLVPDKPGDFRFWAYLTYGIAAFLAFMLGLRVFLYPLNQLPSPLLLPRELAQAMARRLRVLGLLGLIVLVYYASLQVLQLPADARLLARGVFLTLFVLNLLWFIWLVGHLPGRTRTRRRVRGLIAGLLFTGLLAEWLGYRELSFYLLRVVIGTTILIALAWVLHVMLAEVSIGLDRGKSAWQRWLREAVGLSDTQAFPGLSTLRFLLVICLWAGLALALMKLWGVPESLFQWLWVSFQGGFQLGGLSITPSRIILALLMFALLLQVFSRLKEVMEKRWLPASKLDRGAREATATVFGYVGFMVAILVGLSAAGLDLTKLALIAGALSVGIGFGLQNVVNNFVSGLILLFERPISTGDFVSVDETEGYVRRISIRSTEIETLDRRSVIVPNSDLISGRVINWMRNDAFGRIKVEVGVAYGSDLRLVSQILQEIATGHPDVLNDSQTQPKVYCLGFGDSSVNFAIYAVVGNFKQRFQVAHDMYLAIDTAFARHGIEIPFPQRVLHMAPSKSTPRQDSTNLPPMPRQDDPVHQPDPE